MKISLNVLCDEAINGNIKAVENYFSSNSNESKYEINRINFEEVLKAVYKSKYAKDNLDVLNKLINNSNLEQFITIESLSHGFMWSCQKNNVDMAKLFLKNGADIHFESDRGFCLACVLNSNEVIQYLIFEARIEKTQEIVAFLEGEDEGINEFFEKRNLNDKLKEDLLKDNPIKISNFTGNKI